MSTPAFGVPTLTDLMHAGYEIVGVVSQPDKPAGRGRVLTQPPVKQEAARRGLQVLQPENLGDPRVLASFRELRPDLILVAAYGMYLPDEIVAVPPSGCINLHPSLLPRWRGMCPAQAAILAGDAETGVTLSFVTPNMDAGDILAQERTSIGSAENGDALMARLAEMGASLAVETLGRWLRGDITPLRQDDRASTWCDRLTKAHGRLDWSRPAVALGRHVRAFQPWPGAFTTWCGRQLHIRQADVRAEWRGAAVPGQVIVEGDELLVAANPGALVLEKLQLAGRREMSATEFARGARGLVGAVLGS